MGGWLGAWVVVAGMVWGGLLPALTVAGGVSAAAIEVRKGVVLTPAVGTPAAQAPGEAGSLGAMLARVPAAALAGEGAVGRYADVAAQLRAVGVREPLDEKGQDAWRAATWWLPLPEGVLIYGGRAGFRDAFGFDLFQVEQSFQIGEAPFGTTTLLRGAFDRAELRAAWERTGYESVSVGGTTVASLFADGVARMGPPLEEFVFARLNNAAILADGTVVFAETLAGIEEVLATAAGQAPSLAEEPDVRALLGAVPDATGVGTGLLAGALVVPGEALRGATLEEIAQAQGVPVETAEAVATRLAAGGPTVAPMPSVRLALLGVTVGSDPGERSTAAPDEVGGRPAVAAMRIALLMEDRAAAEAAAPVVEGRLAEGTSLATHRRFAELFPQRSVQVVIDRAVVLVELEVATDSTPRVLFNLFDARDLLFVAW